MRENCLLYCTVYCILSIHLTLRSLEKEEDTETGETLKID